MTISMNAKKNISGRPGVALLVVLFIVMVITITTLGFISQSDVELACGQNMILRTEMDYLAESSLEHARGLILNPQDVTAPDEYWKGGTNLQLISGSDFYEIRVDRDASDFCNYIIDCNAYREEGVEKIGLSRLRAELRIDPCIAYWVGTSTTVWPQITINGDVYCDGALTNNGVIGGDVFATGTIAGASIEGRKNELVIQAPVVWPGLVSTDFGPMPNYYIDLTTYLADEPAGADVASNGPSGTNLAGIYYCVGNANMPGNVTINGTLVVGGDLTVSGLNNVITAVKDFHFPALLVGGKVLMKDGSSLEIKGLAQIELPIAVDPIPAITPSIDVFGGLFIHNGDVTSPSIKVNVTAAPAIASIETWSAPGVPSRWRPAAGAFYRSIERK